MLAEPHTADNDSFDEKKWSTRLRPFLKSLSNLESIFDESGELGRTKHALPESLQGIELVLAPGKMMPPALQTLRLVELSVKLNEESQQEEPSNAESALYPRKLRALCKNVKALQRLVLLSPGLATCICSHGPRLEQELQLQDPVPQGLPYLDMLTLKSPFCHIEAGGLRESHWVSGEPGGEIEICWLIMPACI